jgi:hypothetical protein
MAGNMPHVARLVALFVLALAHSIDSSLTFAWDHSPSTRVAGYATSVEVTGLTDGPAYYFVQSYTSDGVVGAPSSELSGQTPTVEPLAISCPSPLLTSFDGKAVSVTLTPTATGEVTPITTTCLPASGSLFPVGSASFICSAVDALQHKASCTSTVVVLAASAEPPALSLTCPTIASVTDSGNSGKTLVKFGDPTFSGGTVPITVSCSPKSGSHLSVGTTTVSCQAIDAARQTAACTTSATVLPGSRDGSSRRQK